MAMGGKITPSTSVSMGFAFVTLFLIVVHLAIKRLLFFRRIKYASLKIITKLRNKRACDINEEVWNVENKYEGLTHTSIELHEPLVVS